MKKEKNSKPFYKRIWFWMLIALIAIGGINSLTKKASTGTTATSETKSSSVNEKFKMTKNLGEDFAFYFKKNAEVIDKGEKVDFVPGGDAHFISVRLGEGWKDESPSRKIYIANEFLKAKNTLFEKWSKEKGYSITKKDTPELLIHVSDPDRTQIAREYKGEMKIINTK
ncbi:hypothetical protein [Streptococcus constellatus]|uniref:hypothetical protein n=1 Tax=Streptococcus constellatus TaxID=76860 RepID=UPI002001ACE4|nr:hypothetical protein [Streptococcus constellatus]